jgi:hypothetical protein
MTPPRSRRSGPECPDRETPNVCRSAGTSPLFAPCGAALSFDGWVLTPSMLREQRLMFAERLKGGFATAGGEFAFRPDPGQGISEEMEGWRNSSYEKPRWTK